jgi:5-methylcytosine-specific restriction protein A
MLEAIANLNEITSAHQKCLERLTTELPNQVKGEFSFRGDAFYTTFHYNRYFWFANPEDLENRYWLVFGFGTPQRRNNITLELNIPFEGISRQIQGLYAKDPQTNEVFLLHRGKIGGGRSGIGRESFMDWLKPPVVPILEPQKSGKDKIAENIICVGSLEKPNFLNRIAALVHDVARFKATMVQRGL